MYKNESSEETREDQRLERQDNKDMERAAPTAVEGLWLSSSFALNLE